MSSLCLFLFVLPQVVMADDSPVIINGVGVAAVFGLVVATLFAAWRRFLFSKLPANNEIQPANAQGVPSQEDEPLTFWAVKSSQSHRTYHQTSCSFAETAMSSLPILINISEHSNDNNTSFSGWLSPVETHISSLSQSSEPTDIGPTTFGQVHIARSFKSGTGLRIWTEEPTGHFAWDEISIDGERMLSPDSFVSIFDSQTRHTTPQTDTSYNCWQDEGSDDVVSNVSVEIGFQS
ncbi:Aste57867_1536 [Aphanomyces stellatus]|uniref:Aste57867_1536 protein n=1 Tax=Aphanomyces stellatus TaxID=120398 RepID=A0A485K6P5_9STRA|nr:hypothetical protein As57867_001535 [Aphanomyces stellatus]VFT78751.1 Aste57867_1536 [Aphanomyces stellatus]